MQIDEVVRLCAQLTGGQPEVSTADIGVICAFRAQVTPPCALLSPQT